MVEKLLHVSKFCVWYVYVKTVVFLAIVHRIWTSLVSVKSWRNMTRSWILLAELTGVWLTWRLHLSTPARRSHSSSLRQRCPLTCTRTHTLTLPQRGRWTTIHTCLLSVMFMHVCSYRPSSPMSWREEIVRGPWRGWEFLHWEQLRSEVQPASLNIAFWHETSLCPLNLIFLLSK